MKTSFQCFLEMDEERRVRGRILHIHEHAQVVLFKSDAFVRPNSRNWVRFESVSAKPTGELLADPQIIQVRNWAAVIKPGWVRLLRSV